MRCIRLLSVWVIMLGSAWAGTQFEVKCSNKDCGYTTSIGLGGGRMFEQASGYCRKCDKVVSLTWKRDAKERPVRGFWDALVGRMRAVFNCPDCKSPVINVDQIEEFKHCPKCGKESLKAKRTLLYD